MNASDPDGHSLSLFVDFLWQLDLSEVIIVRVLIKAAPKTQASFFFRKTLGPEIQKWVIKIYICQLIFYTLPSVRNYIDKKKKFWVVVLETSIWERDR